VNDSEKNRVAYGLSSATQLTVQGEDAWINMRAITFSFVDQRSSRGLEKFVENIPTSPRNYRGAHAKF